MGKAVERHHAAFSERSIRAMVHTGGRCLGDDLLYAATGR